MTDGILENLNTWVTNAVDTVVELGIAAQPFDLQDDSYRQAYDKIYGLYQQVTKARTDLQGTAKDLASMPVSNQIRGIAEGAYLAQEALISEGQTSLLAALLELESRLSRLLTSMHTSYVEFQKTDRESAFNLISAANAP